MFGTFSDRRIISHERYLVRLNRVVMAAVRRGNVVIVGRVEFPLPRDGGLAVRIVASEKYRVEQMMRRYGLWRSRADGIP